MRQPVRRSLPSTDLVLFLLAAAGFIAAIVRAMWFTPPELLQGHAQKIMYVHVPSAWVAFVAFLLTAFSGAFWLFLKDHRLDQFAEASAEVGVVFTTLVLITGPIWAKPVWNTWWQWDARLSSTLFLWFLYVGYLILRKAIPERQPRARYAAIVGILGALLIPFIHLSVYMFNTMHPLPIVANVTGIQMPAVMTRTFFLSLAAFSMVYVLFVRLRYQIASERDLWEDQIDA